MHGTTGRIPQQCWPEGTLTPYDCIAPFRYLDPVNRTVSYESMVHYRGSRYSVPPAYAGQRVHVMAQGRHDHGSLVATP